MIMKLPLWWPPIELGLALSFVIPLFFILAGLPIRKGRKAYKAIVLSGCILAILYLTIFRGIKKSDAIHHINLIPFWSYSKFSEADYRWQIFMNVFLFIPFGCLLSWTFNKGFLKTLLISCILSVLIESIQYLFCLGFCETDDVIHNTLGSAIGYGYWGIIKWIGIKIRKNKPVIRRES